MNIGLQTAVEFLEKRSDLGEVKAEPSFKLSDAQYAALAGAFQQDKEVRSQAEKLLQKKPKEKKRSEETQAEPLLKSSTTSVRNIPTSSHASPSPPTSFFRREHAMSA